MLQQAPTQQYSEIPEEQWKPLWTEEQLNQTIKLYKRNPKVFRPEAIQQIKNHAAHYNKPFYEGEFSITEAFKQFGLGFIGGFTTFDVGEHPDNEYEAISRNLGHLIGFVPAMASPLFKTVGLASQVAKIKSVPMLIADKVVEGGKKLIAPATQAAKAGRAGALSDTANFLTKGAPAHVAEGAWHLGIASGVSAWQGGIDSMMESFFGGAIAGGAFRTIGNIMPGKDQVWLRRLSGSLFMGLPSTMRGATTPEQVYEYLLGGYFGGKEVNWKKHGSMKAQQEIVKQSEKDSELAITRDPKKMKGYEDLEPEVQEQLLKDALVRWGDPLENEGMGLYLIEQLGLGKIVDGKATKEGWEGLKKVIAGEEIATDAKISKGKVKLGLSGAGDGADLQWSRALSDRGVETIQYVPEGTGKKVEKKGVPGVIREVSFNESLEAGPRAAQAGKALGKNPPSDPQAAKYVYRNWFQAKFSDALFGIGNINGDRKTVRGGTGWTVEFAKQLKKPIYMFDQGSKKWNKYDYRLGQFKVIAEPPKLTSKPALVGTRKMYAKEAFQAIEDVVAKTYGEKIKTKKVKGAVEESEVTTPSVTMRPKIIEKETRLENVREEIKAYEEAIGEITESVGSKKKEAVDKGLSDLFSNPNISPKNKVLMLKQELELSISLLKEKIEGTKAEINTHVKEVLDIAYRNLKSASASSGMKQYKSIIKESIKAVKDLAKIEGVKLKEPSKTAKTKKKFTAKDKADILNYEKDLNMSKKEEAQLLSELEKMYEVPSDMTLDKKGHQVPEDLNDTDVGLKIDVDVGKKSEQFVRNHIIDLVDTPEGLTKRMHTFEMAAKTEEILTKYVRRGEEPNTKDFINEIEKEFEVSLSEAAIGNLRQWMNIKNNAIPNRYINLLVQEGKGVESVEVMSEDRRRTPAGNRKFQREPEKILERMFVNAGGELHKDMGALGILDTVSIRTANEGIKDITLSDLRRQDSDVYKKTMARVHKDMANEGFYLFGGRGDADRFYFVKMHPAVGKTGMGLSAKTMAKVKYKPNPKTAEEKLQNEYYTQRENFAKSVAPNLTKKKTKHQFTRDEAKEYFDKAWESNILYDLSLNGFPISVSGGRVQLGRGGMSKKISKDTKAEIDKYIKTLFGPGFIKGVVGYNKRLQIIMTPSWAGSKRTAGEMVDDLYTDPQTGESGKLRYAIVNDLKEAPKIWSHLGNPEFNIQAIKNSMYVEHIDGAIITRDDVVDYMNVDAGMPKSGQNKSFMISTQNDKKGNPMGAFYGKYMTHKAGKALSAEMKRLGLHYIVYKSSAKQHGTRKIGNYNITKDGKLELNAEMYNIDPTEIKYNYSVKQNDHMWKGKHVLVKQALAHLTQNAYSPVSADMINDLYEGTVMKRYRGTQEANETLARYLKEGNDKDLKYLTKNIEDVGINDLLRGIHSKDGGKFADAAYQRLFKINSEAIEAMRNEGEITKEQANNMVEELSEFNQATDRIITQSLRVSKGSPQGALPVMLHKWIRPYRAVMMRNFLVHTVSRPKIGNSGNARIRPYDEALKMDLDKANPRLKDLETRDDIFFLDGEYKPMPIKTYIKGLENTTLEKLWNKYEDKNTSKHIKEQIEEVLRAVVLRVPMDSISGAHALKFRGFTGRDGHGILMHSRTMRSLGGADLDGDESFFYFGGKNKAGEGGGFKKEWKDMYAANKEEYVKYRHLNSGKIITPEEYKKKPKLQRRMYVKYIPDPKTGIVSKPGSGNTKKTYRSLLTESGGDEAYAKALKNSKVLQYALSTRQFISEKAVDGRNTLGPAVSMPQIFKTAHSMMMTNQNGRDVYTIRKKIKNPKTKKSEWRTFEIEVVPRTEKEWQIYQRELSQAMVAFASDPMDEVGLKSYETWYKELYDAYFKIDKVSELPSKYNKKKKDLKKLTNLGSHVDWFGFYGLKGGFQSPSLVGKVNEMNSALFGKDYTNNKRWEESEIRDKLRFLHELSPEEMPVMLAKMGDTIAMTEKFGDSLARRLDSDKVIKLYENVNEYAEANKWLAPILGKSGFNVPHVETIKKVMKFNLYDSDKLEYHASSKEEFLRAIEGTSYGKDKALKQKINEGKFEYTDRKRLLKRMANQSEEFLTVDLHDMVSLKRIVPFVQRLRNNLTGKALKDFDKKLLEIFNKTDSLKKNSYLMRDQRRELDAFYDNMEQKPQIIQDLFADFVRVIPELKRDPKWKSKIATGEETSATMDQVKIDAEIAKYKKDLTNNEKKLFDYFMLGTWDRMHMRRASKAEKLIEKLNVHDPIFHDLVHIVKQAGAKTSLSKLGYSSEAVSDNSIRDFMKSYMDIAGKAFRESDAEIAKTQKAIENLNEKAEIELADGTKVKETIFDSNIDRKVEGTYTADLRGFEGLAKGKLNPKDAKVIEELAMNLKYHYPEIGMRLGEVVRGIMEKDLNAMNREDYTIFNNILKEMRTGTLNQKLDILMGTDPKGRIPSLKKRYYLQFPETVGREVMKYDITWLRNKGAYLTKDGKWEEGKVQKPSWYLQGMTDWIGRLNQQGIDLTEDLTGKLNNDLLFMEGIKGSEKLRKVAIMKMELDYEVPAVMKNENMTPEHKNSVAGSIQRRFNRKVKEAGDLLDKKHRVVNRKGERVERTGWEVVSRIMDAYETSNTKAYEILSGDRARLIKEYGIGWWDKAETEPRLDYNRFLRDITKTYNKGEKIPFWFGIDGLRQIARSMQIDMLSNDKKGWEIRKKLMSAKLTRTGQKHPRGFWPHLFFSGSEVVKSLNKRTIEIMNSDLKPAEKDAELRKIVSKHKSLTGDWIDPNEGLWNSIDRAMLGGAVKDVKGRKRKDRIDWWDNDLMIKSMHKRGAHIPGYSIERSTYESYLRNVGDTYFRQLNQIMTRDIIEKYKKRAFRKGWYKAKDYPDGMSLGKAWENYLKLYAQGAMGNPDIIPNKIYEDPTMKIKGTPYGWWADNKTRDRLNKMKNMIFKGQKLHPKLEKLIDQDWDHNVILKLSNMEAKFQLASLLAHPKSMVANIFGGSMHTIQHAGWDYFKRAQKVSELQKINPEINSAEARNKWVTKHGIIPEFIMYEWGLSKELQSSNAKKFIKEAVEKYVGKDVDKPGLMELAKKYEISKPIMEKAALFMSKPETKLRRDAFVASYLRAYDKYGSAFKNPDHPFLIEMAKKGVKATQFLYNAPYRPAFARTALGKVMTRFMLWSWNAARFRNDVIREARTRGFSPGSEAFERFKRTAQIDLFVFAMGNIFAYSLFETAMPAPWNWLQDTSDWLFGSETERDRAFFGTWPTPVAPLQMVTPPIMRFPAAGLQAYLNDDYGRMADYTIYTALPFGRIVRDFSPYAPGNLIENPLRLMDKWTGFPLTGLQKEAKRMKKEGVYYPWAPSVHEKDDESR